MDFNKNLPPEKPGSIIDASPGATKSIRDTKPWKQATGGIKQAWSQYTQMLANSFRNLDRVEQEALITKFSMIFTIGAAVLLLSFFYSFLPLGLIRILSVPLLLIGSYFAGTRIVAQAMIVRLAKYLK